MLFLLGMNQFYAQKVGVVLSGGGASGLAHVGVLKALEENNIPIDYITGTSMGAIIGAMYASGLSIAEIETFFRSEQFLKGIEGGVEDQYSYFFKQSDEDASWITLKLDKDSLLGYGLPTKIIDPVMMDLEMLKIFGPVSASAGYSFDSLFVPFRCIGADIVEKKEHIFRGGELNEAVRVSSSYPFYFRPIRVNGKLLFDGGLYNNFPADVLYKDFIPDVIIGSNVSTNSPEPDENNLFSLLENMIVSKTDFSLPCENGLVILPDVNSGTFDFDKAAENVVIGYRSTLKKMDEIKGMVDRRQDANALEEKRELFKSKLPELNLRHITIDGVGPSMRRYIEKVIYPQGIKSADNLGDFLPTYYRLIEDDKIQYIYPKLRYDKQANTYDLNLTVYQEKDIEVSFGGNFSSRPVNTGFLRFKYNFFGKTPKSFIANSYFGKYYGSVLLKYKMDFPTVVPFNLEFLGGLNRYDYFESFATFFEDVRPSFIVENETYGGLNLNFPESNKGKITLSARIAEIEYDYYQTDNFTSADTTDNTEFNTWSAGFTWQRNTLNKKLFASEGYKVMFRARYISGIENTIPGSTNDSELPTSKGHNWVTGDFLIENYYPFRNRFVVGTQLNVSISSQPFFNNYTASLIASPFFQPIPESKTLFQEEFRAHQFASVGGKIIYSITNNIELRTEHYMFQPYQTILQLPNDQAAYSEPFENRFYIGSIGGIYHSPLGPLSVNINYYDQRDDPWTWIVNFGYLIFNKRALD